jgi:hypothetical protein
VIVFTHDILFLKYLVSHSGALAVNCHHQHIRRNGETGICSSDVPWIAMNVKLRIGSLRDRLQAIEKRERTEPLSREPYIRDWYGSLREAWETATTEILLGDVVEPYRHEIHTKQLKKLHDITEADIAAVDKGMTECSRWMRGHAAPAAEAAPLPNANTMSARLKEFEDWVQTIRKRRN